MKKEIELDVLMLPPQGKHQHIFEQLENIAENKELILLNDHDPKPLYYQMQHMYPEVYDWEYLQKGEDGLWKVRIFHKPKFNKTVRELVLEFPPAIAILKKYRIDYCCRGDISLSDACAAKGLDGEKVLEEIRREEGQGSGSYPLRFQDWKLATLCDFIESNHHSYVRKNTPQIAQLLDRLQKCIIQVIHSCST